MSTLSKLAQFNNENKTNDLIAKNGSSSTLAKLSGVKNNALYAQQVNEAETEEARAQNNGGFFGGIGYAFEKLGLGILSSLEGIWDYTAGGLAKLFGADDWAEQQFANDWVNYGHADEWYNPSKGWQVVGDVAGGIGTSLPAIAAVAVAGAITVASGGTLSPVAASLISASVAGLGAAGNATKEAYRQTGELGGKEFGYGALVGVTEGAVEGISAGIGAGTGQVVKNISKSFGKEVAKTATRETFGKAVVKGFIGEAFEEGLSEILDPVWARLTYDPNAKNATFQEVGYAALIGGLSGAIMGGADVSIRNGVNAIKGNKINENGKTNNVLDLSRELNTYESEHKTGQPAFELVQNIYNELETSLNKTNGQVTTVKQKMLLGSLQQANTMAVFSPIVTRSAENIVNNADLIAQRLTSYGYTDAKGKPITFTADQIRSGIEINNPKSFATALKNNDILRTLAVADATGQITMNTAKFQEATLMGEKLSSQVDLNRFIETATDSEIKAVGEKLGIENWQTLTNSEFQEKITEFVQNDGVELYKKERLIVKDAENVSPDTAQRIPRLLNMKEDGIVRYYQGDNQIAVIKDGDNYRVYDYTSKRLSKVLTKSEVNKILKQLNTEAQTVATEVRQQLEQESELKRQAAEIDSYAKENIKDYNKLNAPSQSMVRQVIRQGRAAGIAEADVLSYARVSAHSGLNIVFNKEICIVGKNTETGENIYADGFYDGKNNRIVVNPDAKRTHEAILIHELDHAIRKTADGGTILEQGVKNMTKEEKEAIVNRYRKQGRGGSVELIEEINAHYSEGILTNKNLLEKLCETKPTLKEKILNFFKKSTSTYSEDVKLSKEAKSLFNRYKKLFDEFSAHNQGNNATEMTSINKQTNTYALANDDNNGYNNQKGAENGKENSEKTANSEKGRGNDVWSDSGKRGISVFNDYGTARPLSEIVKNSETAQKISEFFTEIYTKPHTETQENLVWHAKNEDISIYFAKPKGKGTNVYSFDGKNLIVNENISEKTLVDILNVEKPINRIVSSDKVAHISAERWTKFMSYEPDAYLTRIPIQQFLDMTTEDYVTQRQLNARSSQISKRVGVENIKNTADEFMYLKIDLKNKTVTEHEGRHRMTALLNAGNAYADVFVIPVNDTGIESYGNISVKGQFNDERYDLGLIRANSEKFAKAIEQVFKYDDGNIRYALPETDSNGTVLTDKQREYFADTKVVDEQGKLKPVYHGTSSYFNTFKSGYSGLYGAGMYFTEDIAYADNYTHGLSVNGKSVGGRVVSAYLNIENPLVIDNIRDLDDIYYKASRREIQENGFTYTEKIEDFDFGKWLRENYDGVIVNKPATDQPDVNMKGKFYIAFKSNQIKDIKNTQPTKSVDIRYALPEVDSSGNKLSNSQRKYFENSKIIDKNGKLCILYHGTDADFTVFDNSKGLTSIVEGGLYFTKNKQVAESFSKAKGNKGRVVEAYLNITGYLDLTNMSRDYISDVIEHIPPEQLELANKRGIRVDGGFTFADLANAVYKRYSYYQNACNVIEGWGYDGIKQDSDTFVAFHSNQIKETSNINPTIDNDIRYALDSNEDIKNLVAVHNITESKLLQSIKIGGLAVPSIAITDVNYGHENFGNISLIFRKETISPTDRRNKVFGSDAYSKRFPNTVNKISEKNLNALLREYDKAARLLGTSVSTIESDLEFTTKENAEYLLSRTDFVKYQYLTEQGINIEMKKKSKQGRAGLPLAYIEEFANKHNEIVDRYNDTEVIDRLTPEVTKVYNKMYSDYGLAKDKSASYKDVDNFLYDVAEFNNKGKNAFIVDDISSFSDDIDARLKGHEKEFQQYVKNIVDKYYEDTKYFRNNNDMFTNSGNRRPFDSLYTKATLENLVSYMTGKVRNEEGYNYGTGSIRSVLSKQFTSIEDIKKSSNRLVTTETMEQLKKVTDTKTFELAEKIAKLSNESNSFIATDTALDLLVDIAKSSQTNSRIISLFNEYYGKIPTQSLVVEIQEYMQTLREYPTEYFEAKPQRAVGFNEVVEVIAPVNTSPEIIKFFQEQGIKIELYDENTNKRSALIKNLPDDIRFALQEDEDNRVVGGLSKAQRAKFVANNTKLKVYSKADAEVIINDIIADRLNIDERYVANLTGKSKTQAIDYLFKQLNGANEGYRGTVALKIADYIVENAVMEDMWSNYSDFVDDSDRELVSYLNGKRHKFDLKGIKGEINYKYDTKNGIFMQWGAKNGGFGADQIAHEMESMGLHTFTAVNEADQFFEMLDAYNAARERLNKKIDKQMLNEYGDQTKLDNLKQQIVRDILLAYDEKGSQSKYGKLVEKYTQKISSLRQQVKDVYERNLITNNILDKAQKMKDLKLGTFLNATDFKSDIFKQSIESLAKIKNRGNLNNAGTHRVIANLRQWYTMENPLLENNYNDDVAFMLDTLSQAKKNYSTTELKMLRDVMSYFVNFVENYNRVYKQGKWIDAIPEAERYINTIHDNEKIKVGIFGKLTGSAYMQTFGDPMTVARRMDRYESNGFYTEMMTELRNAAVDSEIAEMEVKSDYNDFLSSHKKYLAEIKNTKVNFNGVDIPKAQLISLYLTMKRSHSNAGLVLNGFAFVDNDGKRVRVKGFAPSVMTDADILTSIADTKIEIEKHFTDADMQYISILEKAFNKDAKKLKADRDMQRLGFTNATEDYYYPIRRGNIAKNIDTSDIAAELDRVSNSSFNKDTIKGAKQELFIESADTVFNRHIKAVTKYAYLSPAIETFNRLYNLDISGNKNKPVSVSTESTNTWSKANRYFSKLISDIQGIPTTSSEGMKVLRFLRSGYAKFQLGANPKVWVTQLSSLFASSSMLDTDCIIKGMTVSAKDVDTYCSLAKLRNSNNTVAMAQGVLDKLGKFSDTLMAPIGKMDRFVVKRLFGACQVQVQKNGGAKIGTVANKVEAGKMLRQIILETQQNSMATERSAAMRSGNEIMRTITMFSADSMKVVGRVIDSVGELSTLKAKLKITTDSAVRTKILSQIKLAKTKVRKSVIALITSAAFMAGVAKLFRWLYRKDDDENTAEAMTVDFIGNLFGGLPVLKEIYGRFAEGYDIDNYAYSAINDLLDSVQDIYQGVEKIASGKIAEEDIGKTLKKLAFSAGQVLGIPTRNMYNILYGLTKRVSPTTAYLIDSKMYKKNYVSDLNKAIENDDTAMINLIMSIILDKRVGNEYSEVVVDNLKRLYSAGYSVLPKSIGSSVTYNGESIELTSSQQKYFKNIYNKANASVEKMILDRVYKNLSEEKQAKAIKNLYDAYYSKALSETLGVENDNKLLKMSKYISIEKLAAINAGLSTFSSDKDSTGKTITGTKRNKIIKYLLNQSLTDEQRLLILAFQGYTMKDREYRGWTAAQVKNRLLRYILGLKSATIAEKSELAQLCGFEVKNGKIIPQSPYSKNK